MSDPIGRGRPREKSGSRPGPSVPGVRGDVGGGGNAASHYYKAKGRRTAIALRPPFPPPKCPHTPPEEEASNSDDEIAACLGRVAHRGACRASYKKKPRWGGA